MQRQCPVVKLNLLLIFGKTARAKSENNDDQTAFEEQSDLGLHYWPSCLTEQLFTNVAKGAV